jgi:hypothetical protein
MGRVLPILSFALTAALAGQHACAATPEFQIAPRVGAGSLRIDAFAAVNEERVSVDTLYVGGGVGYLTPIGVVVELGADSFDHLSFLGTNDSFSLTQRFVSVGYQAELGNGWRLVPRAGRARWKLASTEGWIFNPGPEEQRRTKGYDYFWEVSVSRRLSRIVALGVSYKQGQYDLGRSRSTTFLVTLGF